MSFTRILNRCLRGRLIETHWQDMIRVALSIRAGRVLPSTLLRKLSSYSRRNRLYQAFQALGQVIRTLFLLRYISDAGLRRQITACTNIVEDYNRFVDWLFFGKQGVITDRANAYVSLQLAGESRHLRQNLS